MQKEMKHKSTKVQQNVTTLKKLDLVFSFLACCKGKYTYFYFLKYYLFFLPLSIIYWLMWETTLLTTVQFLCIVLLVCSLTGSTNFPNCLDKGPYPTLLMLYHISVTYFDFLNFKINSYSFHSFLPPPHPLSDNQQSVFCICELFSLRFHI